MKAKKKTDAELIELITRYEAWLTYSTDHAGTKKAWRCAVQARHFDTPDIRERAPREGFGNTARAAINACFAS